MLPEAVCNRIHANQADAVKTLSRLIGFPSVSCKSALADTRAASSSSASLPQMPWTLCCTSWKNWA